ncbi:MAG: peptidylprolyl isomerase [Oscillospiraceae bacterium]|nr:peptidylprolyl isomerase [Oscillospiraceae bacterium]
MNKKFMSAAALIMSGMLAFSGCSVKKQKNVGQENDYDATVVATIGDEELKLSDFNFAYYTTAGYYTPYMGGGDNWESQDMGGQTLGDYIRESSLEEMIQLVVAEQKAAEYNVNVDAVAKEVDEQKKNVIENNFGGEDGYNEYLAEYCTSDAAVSRYLRRANIINKLLEATMAPGGECEVSDEDMAQLYNDDTYFKVKHVLITTEADGSNDEAALAKANEVIEKLNAGEDIDVLIAEYNEDPGMENQEYYVFTDGEMVTEFYEGTKALEIGSWSQEPVKSSYGYHIIQRYALDPSVDEEYGNIKMQQGQQKFMELLDKWTDEIKVTTNDEALDAALKAQREAKAAANNAVDEDNTDADLPIDLDIEPTE